MSIAEFSGHAAAPRRPVLDLLGHEPAALVRRAAFVVASPVRGLARQAEQRANRRATRRELDGLSDDILSDIGLVRADIAALGETAAGGLHAAAGLRTRGRRPMRARAQTSR